jgi:PBP1b-binding outer membrane lipoprotein LpoB
MNSKVSLIAMIFLLGACASKTTAPTASHETKPVAASAPAAAVTPAPVEAAKSGPEGTVKKEKKSKKAKVQNNEAPAKAEAAVAPSKGKIVCNAGSDSRSVEIKTSEGLACEVIYTKATEGKSIATAKSDTEFCAGVSQKVQKHLEEAGFKCQ